MLNSDLVILMYILIVVAALSLAQNNIGIATAASAAAVYIYYCLREPFASAFENTEGETIATRGYDLDTINISKEQADNREWNTASDVEAAMYADKATDGDALIYAQSKHVSDQSKQAALARTRYTSDNFRPLYEEEFDEQEGRDWWDTDYLQNDMVKDEVQY